MLISPALAGRIFYLGSLYVYTHIYMKLKDIFFRGKGMINLDHVLKSKDIIFLTKVDTVKAMVFPVVMYGCESWTIKKAKH